MNEPSTSPLLVGLFFVGRCMIPVVVLIGISYLLRKFGLVVIEAPYDPDEETNEDEDQNISGESVK
jgi:hypothetical protein